MVCITNDAVCAATANANANAKDDKGKNVFLLMSNKFLSLVSLIVLELLIINGINTHLIFSLKPLSSEQSPCGMWYQIFSSQQSSSLYLPYNYHLNFFVNKLHSRPTDAIHLLGISPRGICTLATFLLTGKVV